MGHTVCDDELQRRPAARMAGKARIVANGFPLPDSSGSAQDHGMTHRKAEPDVLDRRKKHDRLKEFERLSTDNRFIGGNRLRDVVAAASRRKTCRRWLHRALTSGACPSAAVDVQSEHRRV